MLKVLKVLEVLRCSVLGCRDREEGIVSETRDELSARIRRLETQVAWHRRCAAIALGIVCVAALAAFQSPPARQRFGEIDVERINIVGSDGRLALVISNRERTPGVILSGKEIPRELSAGRVGSAGLIFYSERGDEVGGLVYHARTTENGYSATGHLSFDQFRQDQVVALQYLDDGKSRRAGLNIWDRPTDVPIESLIDLLQARRGPDEAARKAAEQTLTELRSKGSLGTHRLFLGSDDRTAAVRLMDTRGRVRVRLFVDTRDVARLEFLDAEGKVVHAIPDRAQP